MLRLMVISVTLLVVTGTPVSALGETGREIRIELPEVSEENSDAVIDALKREGWLGAGDVRIRVADIDGMTLRDHFDAVTHADTVVLPVFRDTEVRLTDLRITEEIGSEWEDYPHRTWSGVAEVSGGETGDVSVDSFEGLITINAYFHGRFIEIISPSDWQLPYVGVIESQQPTGLKDEGDMELPVNCDGLENPPMDRGNIETVSAMGVFGLGAGVFGLVPTMEKYDMGIFIGCMLHDDNPPPPVPTPGR